MWLKISLPSTLRDTPDSAGAEAGDCDIDDIGKLLGETGEWVQLFVRRQDGGIAEGWCKRERTEEAPEPPRQELPLAQFLKNCVDAELWVNSRADTAPHFVTADYLIALANIESGHKNAGPLRSDSDGIGPFQIASSDWAKFVEVGGQDLFADADRDDCLDQCYGAAWLTYRDTRALAEGLANGDDGNDPLIPSLVDVFLAHMCGAPAAIAFRKAKDADQGNRRVDTILAEQAQPGAKHKGKSKAVKTLLRRRRGFLKQNSKRAETIDGMYARIERQLGKELKDSFKLMQTHIPEDLPAVATGGGAVATSGEPPWLKIARDEDKFWDAPDVGEATAKGRERIIEYFAATDFKTNKVQPWCGAFTAHCLKQSGFGDTIIKGAARAANWRQWGNASIPLGVKQIPEGAVVVLARSQGTGSSGHVAFYSRHLAGEGKLMVELLGGNQSNTVRLSKYSASKIAAIRWHDTVPLPPPVPIDGGSVASFSDLLTLISEHEGGKNYDAHYGKIANSNPAFTKMTINQVLDWQRNFVARGSKSSAVGRYQIIRATLLSLLREMGLTGNELFDPVMQDKMAIQLLKRRKLDKFLSKSIPASEFGKFLAQEWASLPVLEGTQGAKRIVARGESFYAGDNLNRALIEPQKIEAALERMVQAA